MRPILEVHDLSKKYKIRHLSGGYLSLRDRIRSVFSFGSGEVEDFWALDGLTFDVMPGESIGIIGRNGAGKSTLLKMLSKITPPTRGKIIGRGRIASLLEVGTGFHPELTGRENVFFNGSLLGMKRREIQDKFDQIVDFSGVEKFLDTPLKHYSSGMQLRLAFSVAAFLEPEILIVDEVLAVGDAEFQKKCIGKMEDVSQSGRTILFVSHNLQAVGNLCKKGLYLKNGRMETFGTSKDTIEKYLQESNHNRTLQLNQKSFKADKDFQLLDVEFVQNSQKVKENIVNGKDLIARIHYRILNKLNRFRIFLDVCDQLGSVIFRSFHDEDNPAALNLEVGEYASILTIPANLLAPIEYEFKFRFGIHNVRMLEPTEGVSFKLKVEHTGNYNKSYAGQYTEGLVCPVLQWEIKRN